MTALPDRRPKQLSLGPLESEILNLVWDLGRATAKAVRDRILADPDRELAYASVTTVLGRLEKKGWVQCAKEGRSFVWTAVVSRSEARAIQARDRLQKFLAIGQPDVVAAFADSLDAESVAQLEAIADRVRAAREAREDANAPEGR